MKDTILKVERLSHRYAKSWAIRDINLEIDSTGILGLLGSNGAGKSTTMNIICGVLNQTEGNVLIAGIDLRKEPEEAKKQIGFLPQSAPLYLDLTVDEYLKYCAHLRLISKGYIKKAIEEAKEKCGITQFGSRLIRNLSGGYRQRVGIAQAIIHKPRLVVLDEPTNGLDPNQILEVRSLIKEIAEDRSIIFSSHILSEIEATCKHIKMIEGGRIVFSDTMDAFHNYIKPSRIVVSMESPPPLEELRSIGGILEVEFVHPKKIVMEFEGSQEVVERIVEISVEKGWRLTEIMLEKSSLNTIFAQLSGRYK